MDERGKREEEQELAPHLSPRNKPDYREGRVNRDGVKPRDQVLHRGAEIKRFPHFCAGHVVDEILVRRPEEDGSIGNERADEDGKIALAISAFRQNG